MFREKKIINNNIELRRELWKIVDTIVQTATMICHRVKKKSIKTEKN